MVNEQQSPLPSADSGDEPKSTVQRETPEIVESRRKLVARWQTEIKADKDYFDKPFKRMRESQEYARLGATQAWVDGDNYTVPIINRHINQAVASLYAKNPKAVAKRKPRLNFQLWDGKADSAKAAMMLFEQSGGTDVNAGAILQEIQQAQTQNQMLDRLGKTMEILFGYYTGENTPNFKQQMKQCVRRAKTCAVGYVELSFQRALEPDPDITAQIDDMTRQIAIVESQLADVADKKITDGDADIEQLRINLEDLKSKQMILIREGLVFDFPRSTEIIPHRAVKQLRGFIGADYVTREFHLTPKEIQEIYKIDIGSNFIAYNADGKANSDTTNTRKPVDTTGGNDAKADKACVWRVQDKRNRQMFTLVDGYPDYIVEPKEHPLQIDGFWSIFSISFNDIEDEKTVYPYSDVDYLKHPQREYNNARQGVREHRVANRPKYFVRKGALEDSEKKLLENHPAHAVIELKGMDEKTTVDMMIQGFRGIPIDPNLYETSSIMKDVLYGVGSQDANLGPTSGATATESSISEQSRMSTLASNVDDLDEFLSDLARAAGQVMLAELSAQTVKEIAGEGAVWPELDREQIAKELFLEIKAGSSGRPNKAAELANMERGIPYLIQIGGINPMTLARRYGDLLDLDVEELIVEGMPSIVALNAMASKQGGQVQPGTGDTATDPASQGNAGAQNTQGPQENEGAPGGQPAYPVTTYDSSGKRVAK